jgi:hypothetical protein
VRRRNRPLILKCSDHDLWPCSVTRSAKPPKLESKYSVRRPPTGLARSANRSVIFFDGIRSPPGVTPGLRYPVKYDETFIAFLGVTSSRKALCRRGFCDLFYCGDSGVGRCNRCRGSRAGKSSRYAGEAENGPLGTVALRLGQCLCIRFRLTPSGGAAPLPVPPA